MDDFDSDSILDVSNSEMSGCLDDTSSEEEPEVSSSTTDEEEILILSAIAAGVTVYYENYLHKVPCRTRPYSGWAGLMDLLNGHGRRCRENFRINTEVFYELCRLLVDNYGLKPMKYVTVEEQLATFMMIVGVREGNKQMQETLQRSGYTISRLFHRVLRACTRMTIDWVRPFCDNTVTHDYIRNNSRYYPYFKDCIGAIDGTHIKAKLPKEDQTPFIGRKGEPTQNIMVACDFDICFTFVLAGWEGSAHDTRIFYDTIRDPQKKFPKPPPGKYYLVDAGYPNINGYLAPYKGQKYHLPDFQRASVYNNHFEMFNHVHSSLRTTIERSFGCWKSRFEIIPDIPINYSWKDQVALVSATMAIHNFIRKTDSEDEDFLYYDRNPGYVPNHGDDSDESHGPQIDSNDNEMDKVRDDICTSLAFGRMGVPSI